MVFRIFLSIVLLLSVVYFALSQKSSQGIKRTALGALALMTIAVIVCLIVYLSSPAPQMLILPDTPLEDIPPEAGKGNVVMAILSIILLLAMFAAVVLVSRREKKR
ncbi:MAG: hypothetical protein FWD36_07990 [Treponema sp.]|nr:hypothetical protein [Treponema sp.]